MEEALSHVRLHSNSCPICKKLIANLPEYASERHLRDIHRVGIQIPTSATNSFHHCSICGEHVPVFPRSYKLNDDNLTFVRRHYMTHFNQNLLKPEFESQDQCLCPFPTCFKVFTHRAAVYTCFFLHPSEDLPIVGTMIDSSQEQEVHSPPSAIGNPMFSSTQADGTNTLDTAPPSPGDASQPNTLGSQSQNIVGRQSQTPEHAEEIGAAPIEITSGTVNGNLGRPSAIESQAELLFRLRCLHGVPEDALSLISQTLNGIEEIIREKTCSVVGNQLLLEAIPTEVATRVMVGLKRRMEDEPLLYTPTLSTPYRRKSYFNSQYDLVHPIFVQVPNSTAKFYVRFDIVELLERFFRDENVKNSFRAFAEVQSVFSDIANQATEDGLSADVRMHSVTDGTRFKDKCGASEKTIVPLILYLDGFSCNDSAGSKSNIHKIVGIYVAVAASPITYSERKSLLLLSLVRQEEIKSHGINHFLEEILTDIDIARNHPFHIGGVEVGVDLLFVLADNLESNGLAGLGGGFSRHVKFVCRHCEISSDDFGHVGSYEEMKEKSTPRLHEQYLRHQQTYLRTGNKTLSKGVVSRSALQDYHSFDLAKDLPSCEVHNFFGGAYGTMHATLINFLYYCAVSEALRSVCSYASEKSLPLPFNAMFSKRSLLLRDGFAIFEFLFLKIL